ncbi:prolyl oligopeptidase family serine peptidase [Streptomyces sp. N502]|uniref:alpha/beta hydrolase family protein n=1 Tax=Streptomyces sp. N502 TaxID=2730916 RepID=UPI003211CE18
MTPAASAILPPCGCEARPASPSVWYGRPPSAARTATATPSTPPSTPPAADWPASRTCSPGAATSSCTPTTATTPAPTTTPTTTSTSASATPRTSSPPSRRCAPPAARRSTATGSACQFQRPERDPIVAEIEAEHGTPEENPAFWREASPITYVDRVTEPLLIQHGTADDTCPLKWSEQTTAAFEAAGKDVRLVKQPGEGHTFYARWRASMDTTMDFFDRHLR